jgi:hypothetical protein
MDRILEINGKSLHFPIRDDFHLDSRTRLGPCLPSWRDLGWHQRHTGGEGYPTLLSRTPTLSYDFPD